MVPLLVAATGTAAAYGAGSSGGGMMGSDWGLVGGAMGLWGLFWMGLLLVPLYLLVALGRRREDGTRERPLSILRERYARGDLSEDEFERRREQLERTE
nr:SHOCT domain-containing protein [Halomicroarcula nitratireducens]